jgi:hypothetical protein
MHPLNSNSPAAIHPMVRPKTLAIWVKIMAAAAVPALFGGEELLEAMPFVAISNAATTATATAATAATAAAVASGRSAL